LSTLDPFAAARAVRGIVPGRLWPWRSTPGRLLTCLRENALLGDGAGGIAPTPWRSCAARRAADLIFVDPPFHEDWLPRLWPCSKCGSTPAVGSMSNKASSATAARLASSATNAPGKCIIICCDGRRHRGRRGQSTKAITMSKLRVVYLGTFDPFTRAGTTISSPCGGHVRSRHRRSGGVAARAFFLLADRGDDPEVLPTFNVEACASTAC
jgi:hypothetical protein